MRIIWLLLIAIALIYGIDRYRHRFVRQNGDVVRLIPPGDLSLAYADLNLLRKANMVGVLGNIHVATDKEYADFVDQTGFDYTRDLEAFAVGFDPAQTFMVGRGRFYWDRLRKFAVSHHGSCESDSCQAPASSPGRWVNFVRVQPDVLAVAVSSSAAAADMLRPPGRRLQGQNPDSALWMKLSHELLAQPAGLPLPLQIFAISMQSAESAFLTAEPSRLRLKAHFVNAATAGTARTQLEIQTRQVKSALTGVAGNAPESPMGGFLAGGLFQVVGSDVVGEWPVSSELLRVLQ